MSNSANTFLSFSVAFFTLLIASHSAVPASQTFKYTNDGEFGEYIVEYDASYRVLPIAKFPFYLCFYNATPDAFILGFHMGHPRSESILRWVWDANRGSPVKENATLTFGPDGNLVLTDFVGNVAWQTGTAGEGVVGLRLLPNGNLVLYDEKGRFIWQSFDHPSDMILVGQSIKATGPTRLVSRLSDTEPVNGPYSFVMEKDYWAMYYQSKGSKKPLLYNKSAEFGNDKGFLNILDYCCEPESGENNAFELGFRFNLTDSNNVGSWVLARPKYNSTYTMLRVDMDENFRMYTYDEHVNYSAWEVTFEVFDRNSGQKTECKQPRHCGPLGVCEDDQCVACPGPRGELLGWSKSCTPPPSCKGGAMLVDYYNIDGVEHYSSGYNEVRGPLTLGQCKDRCSSDCKCLGLFYQLESSKCLLVADLGTLVKVQNSRHAGHVKVSK